MGWWRTKVRQFGAHMGATVSAGERRALADWTTPAQRRLFATMHVADQRHGLDVAASLRRAGVDDPVVLLAGLLHDSGKGHVGLWPRVAYSLGQSYGDGVIRIAVRLPGFRVALATLANHVERSAELAEAAGCSARTVDLIRHQEDPVDPEYGQLLHAADEAN